MHLPIPHISIPRRRATRQWGRFCPHAFLFIPPTEATLAPIGTLSADLEHLPFQRAHALAGKGGRGGPWPCIHSCSTPAQPLAEVPAGYPLTAPPAPARLGSCWRECWMGTLPLRLPLQHAGVAASGVRQGPSPKRAKDGKRLPRCHRILTDRRKTQNATSTIVEKRFSRETDSVAPDPNSKWNRFFQKQSRLFFCSFDLFREVSKNDLSRL